MPKAKRRKTEEPKYDFSVVFPRIDATGKPVTKQGKRDTELLAKAEIQRVVPFKPKGKGHNLRSTFCVEPYGDWSSLKVYNNALFKGFPKNKGEENEEKAKIRSKDFVLVTPHDPVPGDDEAVDDDRKYWVAKVLEFRAPEGDGLHVFALVAWCYWPDDLRKARDLNDLHPTAADGRRAYHGHQELIASNHLDVIDVLTIARPVEVQYFEDGDGDDDDDGSPKTELYWRQYLDIRDNTLSSLREVCGCGRPANPDVLLLQCPSETCKKWNHASCLTDEACQKAFDKTSESAESVESTPTPSIKSEKKDRRKSKKVIPVADWDGKFTSTVRMDLDPPQLEVVDLRPTSKFYTTFENIHCLNCGTHIV